MSLEETKTKLISKTEQQVDSSQTAYQNQDLSLKFKINFRLRFQRPADFEYIFQKEPETVNIHRLLQRALDSLDYETLERIMKNETKWLIKEQATKQFRIKINQLYAEKKSLITHQHENEYFLGDFIKLKIAINKLIVLS